MLGAEVMVLLESCPLAALIVNAAGFVVFANSEARALFDGADTLHDTSAADLLPTWPLDRPDGSPVLLRDRAGETRNYNIRVSPYPGSSEPITVVWIETGVPETSAGLAVREANLRLRYVIEMLPEAVCVFDAKDRYVLWNQKYADLYADIAEYLTPGIPFEEILKISLAGGSIQEVVPDQDAWLSERMAKFRQPVSQEERQMKDGRWLRYDDRRTPDGGAIGMRIDITSLKQREEWLRQLFEANPMPMLLCDGDSLAVLEANHAALQFYGYERSVLLAKAVCDMHADGQREEFAASLRNLDSDCEARTVWRQRTAKGQEHHVLIYVRLLNDGGDRRLLLTIADVSDRVLAEAEANRLAHHDVLTGLPNRMQFYKALDEALKPEADEGFVVVYCLDLDGFKPVNDTFGHAAGDEVLKMTGERLRSAAGGHLVARLGGDEFAILVKTKGQADTGLADRCISAFDEPFRIRGLSISIGVSIGIAAASIIGSDREMLVQAADRALYRAKADGRNTWRMTEAETMPALVKAR
ncbi:diguanylate cyclase with PAS/PAC sensor [Rhizobium sp. CF080]|uniref:diguanylate cyclase domain-containing protein n=1 Tax=Rhizobium sp. (strain CF080) TaxID=1144310 RepID=UPI0002715631|nr:diguanylate cyclase [Rhizobium sp. CF080]EUB99562.1 diguanylate cyclase with PAS/PAC sensor [Rhizobium sp. CF080]